MDTAEKNTFDPVELAAILDALDAATWSPDTTFDTLFLPLDGQERPAKDELLRFAPAYPDMSPDQKGRFLGWITPSEIRAAAPELDLFLKRRSATPEAPDLALVEDPDEPEAIEDIEALEAITEALALAADPEAGGPEDPEEIPEEAPETLPEPLELADLVEAAGDIEAPDQAQEGEEKPWADFEELA